MLPVLWDGNCMVILNDHIGLTGCAWQDEKPDGSIQFTLSGQGSALLITRRPRPEAAALQTLTVFITLRRSWLGSAFAF